MGLTLIFFSTLITLAGIVFIVWRKIPLLLELSEESESMRELVAKQAKNIVSSQKLRAVATKNVDKTISRARTLALKTERHTGELMGRLRKKEKDHKEEFTESYWDQLGKRGKKK